MSDLDAMLKNVRPATPQEIRKQRESYVIAEAAIGSDADERAMRRAVESGDDDEVRALEAAGEKRAAVARGMIERGEI